MIEPTDPTTRLPALTTTTALVVIVTGDTQGLLLALLCSALLFGVCCFVVAFVSWYPCLRARLSDCRRVSHGNLVLADEEEEAVYDRAWLVANGDFRGRIAADVEP